jgi:hypothetical protein
MVPIKRRPARSESRVTTWINSLPIHWHYCAGESLSFSRISDFSTVEPPSRMFDWSWNFEVTGSRMPIDEQARHWIKSAC